MARKSDEQGDASVVTLVDKEGNEVTVASPSSVNSLVYGQGYRVKGDETVPEAAARLAEAPDSELTLNPGPIEPADAEQT
jgi:hypothetical protein